MKKTNENNQKYFMYKETIKKLDKAIKNAFYYEAIMIEYALIEDRLNTILEKLGIINITPKGPKLTNKVKKPLHQLLYPNKRRNIMIKNIGTKIEVIDKLNDNNENINPHIDFTSLKVKEDKEDIKELTELIKVWKDKRNKYVHGLMNEVPCEVDENIIELVNTGYCIFRRLDNFEGRMNKYKVRKTYRIQ